MTQEQKAIKIIYGLSEKLFAFANLGHDEGILFVQDWYKFTMTIQMPDGKHVHLGEMCCEDSFDRLIDDLFNHFCRS